MRSSGEELEIVVVRHRFDHAGELPIAISRVHQDGLNGLLGGKSYAAPGDDVKKTRLPRPWYTRGSRGACLAWVAAPAGIHRFVGRRSQR